MVALNVVDFVVEVVVCNDGIFSVTISRRTLYKIETLKFTEKVWVICDDAIPLVPVYLYNQHGIPPGYRDNQATPDHNSARSSLLSCHAGKNICQS